MKITEKWLKKKGACTEAGIWIEEQNTRDLNGLLKLILKADEDEKYSWACWGLSRIFNQKQRVRFAIYCAEKVIKIFEDKYPKDKRPRKAIQAAKRWLKNPSKKNKAAASAYAAYAAAAAAYAAAYASAYAAYAAAAAADACADAYAAYAAADACADASAYAASSSAYADASAYAAERKKMYRKFVVYGIKLLKEKL